MITFIKNLNHFNGDARLYELSKPIKYDDEKETSFIVISAVIASYSGAETYIFPSDKKGKILNWTELKGSFRGELNHEKALEHFSMEHDPERSTQ
jgi:hypothetical protein